MTPWAQMIAGNLLVASLIGGLAWGVGRSGHRAGLAHTLWLIFFFKLITPPIVAIPFEVPEQWWLAVSQDDTPNEPDPVAAMPEGAPSATARPGESQAAIAIVANAEAAFSPTGRRHPLNHYLLIGWAVGSAWIVIRGLIRLIRFHRLLQRHGIRDEEATRFVWHLLQSERRNHSVA